MLSQQWLQDSDRTLIDKNNLSRAVSSIIASASQPDFLPEIMNPVAVSSIGYAITTAATVACQVYELKQPVTINVC